MISLFKHTQNLLGLDISDVSIKIVELEPKASGFKVQSFSDTAIPKEVMAEDQIKDPKLLIKIIKDTIQKPKFGKVTSKAVVASIPETKSFVRVIQMPRMSEAEAAEAIQWEAEQYIPIPVGQVYLDWLILKTGVPGAEEKMTVLLTASPKDYIDDFTRILKEAGLAPRALEVESQAVARSLISQTGEAVMVIDIDTVRTSLIIYDRNTLQFTSSIPIAGNVFTESVARSLGVASEEAEKLKREFGLDQEARKGELRAALMPVVNNLVAEIKNTIRFYEEHDGGKISRLLLSGGSSKLKHLPSFLHESLTHGKDQDHALKSVPGIKVELGNPWEKILPKGQVPPMSREDSLSYATALGLALWEGE